MSTLAPVPCNAKHTDYEPKKADWRCPKCNATPDHENGGLVIQASPDEANPDCGQTHPGDEIECENCKSTWSGSTLMKALKKRDHVMTCPTCKGAGVIPIVDA